MVPIYVGRQVELRCMCPQCGRPVMNYLSSPSAFIAAMCNNPECDANGIRYLVERQSGSIIQVDPYFVTEDNTRVYPVLADKEGTIQWPEWPFKARKHGKTDPDTKR